MKWLLRIGITGTAGLAIGAMILSYSALYIIAEDALVPHRWVWLWPITIDLALFLGAIFTLIDEYRGLPFHKRMIGWVVTLLGVTYSTWVQLLLAPASPYGLARTVHASPPVVAAIMLWLLARCVRLEIIARREASGDATAVSGSARVVVDESALSPALDGAGVNDTVNGETTLPYGESGERVAGVEVSPEAVAVAHSATRAEANARTVSARHRADTVRKGRDTDSIAAERAYVRAALERGDTVTGESLARAMGGRYKAARGRQILQRLRSEVKQDAAVE